MISKSLQSISFLQVITIFSSVKLFLSILAVTVNTKATTIIAVIHDYVLKNTHPKKLMEHKYVA